MMNSYFEQGGFYGQSATGTGGADQAYRFPLGLAGMGGIPGYGSGQHQNSRPQDTSSSAYDAAAAAAAAAAVSVAGNNNGLSTSPKGSSLYSSPISDSPSTYKNPTTPTGGGSGGGGTTTNTAGGNSDCKDQNGYSSSSSSLSKELNAGGSGSGSGWTSGNGVSSSGGAPVRPSACTPDPMSRYTPSAADMAARDRWMNSCTGLTSPSQASQPQLQQSANHTFYPWMAIAGKLVKMFYLVKS